MKKRERYILTELKYGGLKIYDMTPDEYDLIEDILHYLDVDVQTYNFINMADCDIYEREDEEWKIYIKLKMDTNNNIDALRKFLGASLLAKTPKIPLYTLPHFLSIEKIHKILFIFFPKFVQNYNLIFF